LVARGLFRTLDAFDATFLRWHGYLAFVIDTPPPPLGFVAYRETSFRLSRGRSRS
jgi:hypothetical protein